MGLLWEPNIDMFIPRALNLTAKGGDMYEHSMEEGQVKVEAGLIVLQSGIVCPAHHCGPPSVSRSMAGRQC